MIHTKKHFLNFYLKLVFYSIFLSGSGLVALCIFLYQLNYDAIPTWGYFLPLGSLIAFLANFKLFTDELKKVPSITLDLDKIVFRYVSHTEEYQLNELKDVNFTGKHEVGEMIRQRLESMQLVFTGGQTKVIPDKSYENFWEVKLFLFKLLNPESFLKKPEVISIGAEDFAIYKGKQVLCFYAWLMWIFVFGFLLLQFVMRVEPTIFPRLFCLSFSVIFFWSYSRLMNYFGLSESYLKIKNHNFFWVATLFRLKDIREVLFEQNRTGKITYTQMVVIFNDFKTKSIPGLTLRKGHWMAMKVDLEKRGIMVRNEVFFPL